MNKIFLVASREFKTRVQKKTFLLSTIGLPILIFGFYALMIYFQVKTTDNFKVAVSDQSKLFNGKIDDKKSTEVIFSFIDADTAVLNKKLIDKEFDAYLFIPNGYNLQSGEPQIAFRSSKALGLMTREKIENRINNALEEKKLLALNISKGQLDSARLENNAIAFTTNDGKKDNETKVGISYAVGMIAGFLIYIILFVYGTMVMRGVMEEKTNRIAEVIVSSVKPFQLMIGKIIGIKCGSKTPSWLLQRDAAT